MSSSQGAEGYHAPSVLIVDSESAINARVENNELEVVGGFHSDQWGSFRSYFRFPLSATGKIVRLDIGQAS